MSGYLSQETLEALKVSRYGDLLCHDCTFKMAGRMSGQAFTDYVCQCCKQKKSYANTGTPQYCKGCAFEKFSCQRCMQSLEKDLDGQTT